jgi:hypothetical protein
MKRFNPLAEYLKPQGGPTNSMPNMPQSPLSQSLGNSNSEPIAPNVDLPRHALKTDFAPSAMSQSLDNVNMNKGARRNVASDDWFSIGSTANHKDFF